MRPLEPLYTAHLFPPLHAELIALLRSLTPEDWERPTVAGSWRVRDVVAHLLDVSGREEEVWSVIREDGRWQIRQGVASRPAAIVETDADTAWRLLYNALPREAALERVSIEGDAALVEPFLSTRSVMV